MTNFGIVDLFNNGIRVEIGGETIGQIKIPSDYVPRAFAPVLGEHHLIAGDKLQNGLIVLLEDTTFRRSAPSDLTTLDEYELQRLNEVSRWALVTDLQVIQRDGESSGPLVKFTAIYADGTMRDRSYAASYKWSVLKQFEMLSVCENCGVVHTPEEAAEALDLDKMTAEVTSQLFGEELSFQEFSDRLIDDEDFLGDLLDKTMEKVFGGVFGGENEQPKTPDLYPSAEIPADRPQLPGETDDEYADRLRDEDEVAGEYIAGENAKIKQQLADDEALAALRAKLRGDKPVVSISTNEI